MSSSNASPMMISKAHKVNYNNTGRRLGSIAQPGKPRKCSRCRRPPPLLSSDS